jgi:hypothetical protein
MYVLYRSILAIFAEHGRETGESEIKEFLPGLSRKGSGDDVSIAGIVSATLSTTFIEVLKAQCEYSNAKSQREQAEREVTLAAEKQEYVLSAMKKAKTNYDLCVQKANDAQEAIEVAQRTQEDAIRRFEAAEMALSSAVTAYQNSIALEETDVSDIQSVEPLGAERTLDQDSDIAQANDTANHEKPSAPGVAEESNTAMSIEASKTTEEHTPTEENGTKNGETIQ